MAEKRFNPFYAGVVLASIAFVVTALSYVVTLVEGGLVEPSSAAESHGPVFRFFADHGGALLLWEVVALGVFALLAMALDSFRTRGKRSKPS